MAFWLTLALAASCCLALSAGAQAKERRLPITEEHWATKVFPPKGVPVAEAATLSIGRDPQHGPCLIVGPWRRGDYSARFQYSTLLPLTTGIVHGSYRTEAVPPYGVTVVMEFYARGQRVASKHLSLPPAMEWTPFNYAFRTAPPGADAVSPGFGLAWHTEGRVSFADLSIDPDIPPADFPAEPGACTRPAPPRDFRATGLYRVEERNGAWWLVTPEGGGFYSLGSDGPWLSRGEHWQEEGGRAAELLRTWGFNSLAGWTNVSRWGPIDDALVVEGKRPFAMFAAIETGTWKGRCDQLLDGEGQTTGEGHAFPDPFDPRFEQAYREDVHRIAEVVRGKSWFVGYFADNEVSHNDLDRHVYSPHCATALRDFLSHRYHGDLAALSAAWGVSASSFEALLARRPEPTRLNGPMHDDLRAFSREIVARYIDVTRRVLREEDPDHLAISNRFMLGDVGAWMDYLDLYSQYDIVSINLYPANQQPGLSEAERSIYRLAYEKTGRPVIVGEWSIPAVDSGLYAGPQLDWSWDEALETQTQRARQAACVTVDFYNMPFVVGSHWFIWGDIDTEKRRANRGLVRADGRPWEELTAALTRVHARIGVGGP